MAIETKNVFLDTEVFEHHHFDVLSAKFRRFARLAAEDELCLIETDVTISEVRSHIPKSAKISVKQLADIRKASRIVKELISAEQAKGIEGVSEESLTQHLHEELGKFLLIAGAKILSVNSVPPATIFEKYFQAKAAFNDTKKKVEFPDAFAAAALEAWCNSHPGQKLYVVSGDADWRRLCYDVKPFIHVKQLELLLEIFADSELAAELKQALRGQVSELTSYVSKRIEDGDIYFFVDDSVLDGYVNDIPDFDISISDIYLVEAGEATATLSVTFDVKVSLLVSGDDPDSMYRDPDDRELKSVWTVSGTVERDIEMEANVDVTFAKDNPSDIQIKTISLEDQGGISISVEEHELSRDDYDEDDEPEIFGPDDVD